MTAQTKVDLVRRYTLTFVVALALVLAAKFIAKPQQPPDVSCVADSPPPTFLGT